MNHTYKKPPSLKEHRLLFAYAPKLMDKFIPDESPDDKEQTDEREGLGVEGIDSVSPETSEQVASDIIDASDSGIRSVIDDNFDGKVLVFVMEAGEQDRLRQDILKTIKQPTRPQPAVVTPDTPTSDVQQQPDTIQPDINQVPLDDLEDIDSSPEQSPDMQRLAQAMENLGMSPEEAQQFARDVASLSSAINDVSLASRLDNPDAPTQPLPGIDRPVPAVDRSITLEQQPDIDPSSPEIGTALEDGLESAETTDIRLIQNPKEEADKIEDTSERQNELQAEYEKVVDKMSKKIDKKDGTTKAKQREKFDAKLDKINEELTRLEEGSERRDELLEEHERRVDLLENTWETAVSQSGLAPNEMAIQDVSIGVDGDDIVFTFRDGLSQEALDALAPFGVTAEGGLRLQDADPRFYGDKIQILQGLCKVAAEIPMRLDNKEKGKNKEKAPERLVNKMAILENKLDNALRKKGKEKGASKIGAILSKMSALTHKSDEQVKASGRVYQDSESGINYQAAWMPGPDDIGEYELQEVGEQSEQTLTSTEAPEEGGGTPEQKELPPEQQDLLDQMKNIADLLEEQGFTPDRIEAILNPDQYDLEELTNPENRADLAKQQMRMRELEKAANASEGKWGPLPQYGICNADGEPYMYQLDLTGERLLAYCHPDDAQQFDLEDGGWTIIEPDEEMGEAYLELQEEGQLSGEQYKANRNLERGLKKGPDSEKMVKAYENQDNWTDQNTAVFNRLGEPTLATAETSRDFPEGLPPKFEDDLEALAAGNPTIEELDAFVQEFNNWDATFADPEGDFKTEAAVADMKLQIFQFAQGTEGILFTVDDITKANSLIEYQLLDEEAGESEQEEQVLVARESDEPLPEEPQEVAIESEEETEPAPEDVSETEFYSLSTIEDLSYRPEMVKVLDAIDDMELSEAEQESLVIEIQEVSTDEGPVIIHHEEVTISYAPDAEDGSDSGERIYMNTAFEYEGLDNPPPPLMPERDGVPAETQEQRDAADAVHLAHARNGALADAMYAILTEEVDSQEVDAERLVSISSGSDGLYETEQGAVGGDALEPWPGTVEAEGSDVPTNEDANETASEPEEVEGVAAETEEPSETVSEADEEAELQEKLDTTLDGQSISMIMDILNVTPTPSTHHEHGDTSTLEGLVEDLIQQLDYNQNASIPDMKGFYIDGDGLYENDTSMGGYGRDHPIVENFVSELRRDPSAALDALSNASNQNWSGRAGDMLDKAYETYEDFRLGKTEFNARPGTGREKPDNRQWRHSPDGHSIAEMVNSIGVRFDGYDINSAYNMRDLLSQELGRDSSKTKYGLYIDRGGDLLHADTDDVIIEGFEAKVETSPSTAFRELAEANDPSWEGRAGRVLSMAAEKYDAYRNGEENLEFQGLDPKTATE